MKRILVVAVIASFPWAAAWAQESTGSLAERSPSENNASGNVQARAPSTWVAAARARHQAYINARVNNPRSGEAAGTLEGLSGETASSSGTGGLSGLLDLVTELGGVSGLTDGLTGGSGTTTGGTSGGSGMTLADLLALRDQLMGGGTSKQSNRAQSQTAATGYETRDASGAIGRLPKLDLYAQSQQTTERKFVARWAESMVQTIFTSLAIGFQSQDFVGFLKDALRPVFFPEQSSATDGSGGNSNGSGSGSGGIEDVNNPGGGGGSGSLV